MYYVYILYSAATERYYVGQSQYREKRLRQHRREKLHWTRCASDWQEIFSREVEGRIAARELEVKIKKRGARRFLSDIGT